MEVACWIQLVGCVSTWDWDAQGRDRQSMNPSRQTQGLSQLQKCHPVTSDKLLLFLNLTLLIWKLGDGAIHHADRELLKRMTT